MKKQALGFIFLIVVVSLTATLSRAQDWPLTQDDIKILLIGGAKPENMIEMIQRRGVNFQMNPDLAKKFHDMGASDDVIEALQRATVKQTAPSSASATKASAASSAAPANASSSPPPAATSQSAAPAPKPQRPASVQERVNQTLNERAPMVDETGGEAAPATRASVASAGKASAAPAAVDLREPSPVEIQHIIQEFASKEKLFKQARDNYAYHQINKVDELGDNNEVVGTYRQDWDILFDDSGKRVEQVTYAPLPTLKGLMVTEEDLNSFRSIQPFVLTTDELPEYDIKYYGHVKVDEITAYVFHIRPKEIKKGQQYFDGIVWVDDRDLQIVKTEGKTVPELKTKNGENLFPRFTTYREQIDGKFWFPTFTMADDTLYFPGNPIHIKEVIRYTNYKQFKASSTIKVIGELPSDKQNTPSKPNPPKN